MDEILKYLWIIVYEKQQNKNVIKIWTSSAYTNLIRKQ